MGSSLHPSTPAPCPPPSNVVAKKAVISTHFAQNSTLLGVRGGGGVTSFINITGKVPALLTAIIACNIRTLKQQTTILSSTTVTCKQGIVYGRTLFASTFIRTSIVKTQLKLCIEKLS